MGHKEKAEERIRSKHGFDTTQKRSKHMRKIKAEDTKAEVMLRKAMWQKGYRYRKNYKQLPGKPDIAFTKQKVAVFVDGEFWHGYNWEEKKKKLAQNPNREYWIKKIEGNMARDRKNGIKLANQGWFVLRFWERQIKRDLSACVEIISGLLEERKET